MLARWRFSRSDAVLLALTLALSLCAGLLRYLVNGSVASFVVSGLALAALATLVARSIDRLGDRFGAGATGVLQSALGNLPELFVGVFALRAGLRRVVEAAVAGSILSNLLLVLGLALLVGGLRHGVQRFRSEQPRLICTLLLLAVAALLVPSLAGYIHTPAAGHERALSVVASVVLLAVFVAGVPGSLRRAEVERADARAEPEGWPTWLAVVLLMTASALSGFVAAWFVDALTPAIRQLHISQAFAGLVIVAIAGNAVENAVGVTLAARNRVDYALSVVLNSPLQVALVLAPLLVLLSYVVGGVAFTLVFPPLLVAALAGSVLIVSFIIVDGESVWLEGAALVGLYVLVAASFWWG